MRSSFWSFGVSVALVSAGLVGCGASSSTDGTAGGSDTISGSDTVSGGSEVVENDTATTGDPDTTDSEDVAGVDTAAPDASEADVEQADIGDDEDTGEVPTGGIGAEAYPLVACPAGLEGMPEVEPNDSDSPNDLSTIAAPGFCIQGAVLCGNDGDTSYLNDLDLFLFDVAEDAGATITLTWSDDADLDKVLTHYSDTDDGTVISNYEEGDATSESSQITLEAAGGENGLYAISVACWSANAAGMGYALSVTYDTTDPGGDVDTDVVDSDTVVDTDVVDTDTVVDTDVIDTDTVIDTDVIDTDVIDTDVITPDPDVVTPDPDVTADAGPSCTAETLTYTASVIDSQINLQPMGIEPVTVVAAEAFTPPTSFSVASVVLPIKRCDDYGELKVLITGLTTDGLPDLTNVLGSTDALTETTVPPCDNVATDMTFTFTTAVPVTAGTTYALALQRTPATTMNMAAVSWYGGDTPPAFVGASWLQNTDGSWDEMGTPGTLANAHFVAFAFNGEICQ